mgnify:CR=1 FL=1
MYTYLLINLFTIIGPLALSFDKKVAFYKKIKYLIPGQLITALLFLIWDHWFTVWGVWGFNDSYITGIKLGALPLEEIMFFLTVPYACVFIYECLNIYFPSDPFKKIVPFLNLLIIAICIFLLINYYNKLYTAITALFTLFFMIQQVVIGKRSFLGQFYRAYLVAIIPFLIVNGILTSLPVVWYNDTQNLGIRIYTIPADDLLYNFLLFIMNISFYEFFQRKFKKD